LGQQGLYLRKLARGEVQRELVLAELPSLYKESMELEEPLELLEPLAFVLNRLLEQLMERLRKRSLATDHVRVDLALEIHHDRQLKANAAGSSAAPLYERTLKLPVPTQDVKVLLKLLQLDLEAHPPHGPVKKVSVEAFAARIQFGQGGLFEPQAPEPAKLEITLARLRALVGEKDEEGRGCVGFPQVLDSHKPDSFFMRPSMPERNVQTKMREQAGGGIHRPFGVPSATLGISPAGSNDHPNTGSPRVSGTPTNARNRLNFDSTSQTFGFTQDDNTLRMALRRFRPPIRARVETSRTDEPTAIIFGGVRAKIRNASGPWRISGEWWDQAAQWQRDEWDVEITLEGGMGLYKIFREVQSGQWFVEGMYD
jgi:hypothetical protein